MKGKVGVQKNKRVDYFLEAHWPAIVFLLHYAAGTLFTDCPGVKPILEMVEMELEDARNLLGPGDWSYEIAQLVENGDINKIFELIGDVVKQLKGRFV